MISSGPPLIAHDFAQNRAVTLATGSTRVHVWLHRELSRACQAPMVTADISAILWMRIAVMEGYLRERGRGFRHQENL